MAWNGSGTFSRTNGDNSGSTTWADDQADGDLITASRHDTHDQDLANGINACLAKNGENTMAGNIVPSSDSTYNLGSNAARFAELFTDQITMSGKLVVGDQQSTGTDATIEIGDATLTTGTASIELGKDRTGDGAANVDFWSDSVNTDYGTRAIRAGGQNGTFLFSHKGTGTFSIENFNAADFVVKTNNTTALTIDGTSQDVTFAGDIDVQGGQIKFPATANPSADANTLDDYQEGEYTATLTPATSGTITVDPAENTLAYTKIGQRVFVSGTISVSAVSSPVGGVTLNVPFNVASLTESAEEARSVVAAFGLDNGSFPSNGYVYTVGLVSTSTVGVQVRVPSTTSIANLSTYVSANSEMGFDFSYVTDE